MRHARIGEHPGAVIASMEPTAFQHWAARVRTPFPPWRSSLDEGGGTWVHDTWVVAYTQVSFRRVRVSM